LELGTERSKSGLLYGLAAYGLWGAVPLYFVYLNRKAVSPEELLAHRIVWSMVLLAIIQTCVGRWKELGRCWTVPRTRRTLLLTSLLIAANWYFYIFAATHERLVEASLGYFITPLASAALGLVVLRERLRRVQTIALLLAAAGVVVLTVQTGVLPWLALTLAGSFSLYGLFRKTVAADALTGLTFESLVLMPFALGWGVWMQIKGTAAFGHGDSVIDLLLLAASVITVVPLYCFAQAARRLRLSTIGFLQYIAPTLQMLVAVTIMDEPFHSAQLYGFVPIWAALAIYSADAVWAYRKRERVLVNE